MQATYRLLKYLHGTSGKGILFKMSKGMNIKGYADADWAGDVNDRKSTSGYCYFIGDNPITWKNKKQIVVARSSVEAKCRAMTMTICELLWTKHFNLLSFKTTTPITLYSDNKAAMHICKNPIFHERTKHIEIDYHLLRECAIRNNLQIASGNLLIY